MSFHNKSLIMTIFIVVCFSFSGCYQKDNTLDNNYRNTDDITTKGSNFTLAEQTKDVEAIQEKMKTYKNERFGFSVDYPNNWNAKEVGTNEATSENESSPDSGIEIYLNKNEDQKIYVYGQIGHINIPSVNMQEEFVTNDGVSGTLYIDEYNGRKIMNLVLGEGFVGANINVSLDCFKQNKEQITDLLKSIKS